VRIDDLLIMKLKEDDWGGGVFPYLVDLDLVKLMVVSFADAASEEFYFRTYGFGSA